MSLCKSCGAKTRAVKLQFWLFTMDVIAFFGGYGTDLYLWAVHHASNNEEWFR